MAFQRTLAFKTTGRGTTDITAAVQEAVRLAGIETGLANLFIHHTSASLLLTENADPQVRRDLETFLAALVPDGDAKFSHDDEGPDDMPAHVRTVLTESVLTLPVTNGLIALGTWQGIFLYEHRKAPHERHVTITLLQ